MPESSSDRSSSSAPSDDVPAEGVPLADRIARQLVSWRHWLFGLAVILTVLLFPISCRLELNRSIESLYPEGDPHFAAYQASKRLFGGDEFVIVAWQEEQNVLTPDGQALRPEVAARLDSLAERLSRIDGVLTKSTQQLGPVLAILTGQQTAVELSEGLMIGEDHKTLSVILRLIPEASAPVPRAATLQEIRRVAAEQERQTWVAGEPVQIHDMFDYVERDGHVLFLVSLGLLSIAVCLLFRSLRWVLLPVLLVGCAIVWTNAALVLSGLRLSMVSSMLNSILTIIGVSTVMHVAVHFRELRRTHERSDAAVRVLADLLPAVFWTCATTAVGFLALLASDITPVRSFGVMMSLGTAMVFLGVLLILPAGILLGFGSDPRSTLGERQLLRGLDLARRAVLARPAAVVLGFAVVSAASLYGLSDLRVETDFSKNFRAQSPLVRSLVFVEENLGGAGTWEVNFPAPTPLTEDYLDRVQELTERLRGLTDAAGERRITKVVALPEYLELTRRQIPFFEMSLPQQLAGLNARFPEVLPTLYAPQAGRMRLVLRARERQPAESKTELIADVERVAREVFSDGQMEREPEATGLFVLLAFLIENLLRDQWLTMSLAAGGIAVTIAVAARSVYWGLASLLPNLFPIVAVIGVMGWLDLPINIATAMIASVSIGLSVDSTVHYLFAFRRHLDAGDSARIAMERTQRDVGRALLFDNFALVVGFLSLTLSEFVPLIYFGALVSVAMLGGVIGNLFLIPLLIRLRYRSEDWSADATPEAA